MKKNMTWRKGKALNKLGTYRGEHIDKTKDPKLNGEQRPLGFGARQFAEQKIFLLGAGFRPPFLGLIMFNHNAKSLK